MVTMEQDEGEDEMSVGDSRHDPQSPRPVDTGGVTISMSGAFNPAIMLPTWFRGEGLLKTVDVADIAGSEDLYAHPDFVRFRTADLAFEVSREILELATRSQDFEPRLVDLAVGLLAALPHTPIAELSVVRYAHLSLAADGGPTQLVTVLQSDVDTGEDSERTGPPFAWNRLVRPAIWENLLKAPRLSEMTMRGGRADGRAGEVLITVEPSLVMPGGVFVAHTDVFHLQQAEQSVDASAGVASQILSESWEDTRAQSQETFAELTKALAQGPMTEATR